MTPAPLRPIPAVRGHWLLGSARGLKDRPHSFPLEICAATGGIAAFRILHRRLVAVTHPEFLRHILVTHHERYERSFHYRTTRPIVGKGLLTTDGPLWKTRRRQIQPAFRAETLRRIVPATAAATEEMFARWEVARVAGTPIPLRTDMQTLTLGVICRALLSVGIDSQEAQRFGDAVRNSLYLVRRRNNSLCPVPHWIPDRTNRALGRTRDVLDTFVSRHLAPRRQAGAPVHDDIAQALLDARDPETGAPLSWEALLAETKTLFVAGFETTATMLTWALHELSQHPEIAARWQAEVDAVLGGRAPGWDDLARLVYTDQIVQEALRLYPPVYTAARVCVADDEVGGFAVKRGTTLLLSIYGAHRDPAFWPEPTRFDPDRFAPGREWPRHAYLPFLSGRHTCIGNSFALAEAVLALAHIAQRYRLVPLSDRAVPIRAQVTLAPAHEIPIRLVARR